MVLEVTGPVYVVRFTIGWGQCDPAGIVYFPRFFELFHDTMEQWFTASLAMPYRDIIVARRLGFPTVHTHADFRKPTHFGEQIDVEMQLAKLGRCSIQLEYRVLGAEHAELRGNGQTVCVAMDLDPQRDTYQQAVPIPDDLRARMDAFVRGRSVTSHRRGALR